MPPLDDIPQTHILTTLSLVIIILFWLHWAFIAVRPRCFPRGNPACRGTFGGRRKAVRDRFDLQGGEVQSLVAKGMFLQVLSWPGGQCVGRGGLWAEQTLHRVGGCRKRR